jgi:3-hydroxyacyl-CoA dehydrogenase
MNAPSLPPLERYRRILVLGAGVMGRGIALVSIRAGFDTWLYDPSSAAREEARAYARHFLEQSVAKGKISEAECEAALRRLSLLPRLQDLEADFVIEAAPEKLEIKIADLAGGRECPF